MALKLSGNKAIESLLNRVKFPSQVEVVLAPDKFTIVLHQKQSPIAQSIIQGLYSIFGTLAVLTTISSILIGPITCFDNLDCIIIFGLLAWMFFLRYKILTTTTKIIYQDQKLTVERGTEITNHDIRYVKQLSPIHNGLYVPSVLNRPSDDLKLVESLWPAAVALSVELLLETYLGLNLTLFPRKQLYPFKPRQPKYGLNLLMIKNLPFLLRLTHTIFNLRACIIHIILV